MNSGIRVFVNADAVDLPAGADVGEALRAADPVLAEKVASGMAFVTDGRGIEIDTGARLSGGAILRVVVRARARSSDADP